MSSKLRRAAVEALCSLVVVVAVTAAQAASTNDAIDVNVDQARLVRLPDHIATIVVGNPLVADVNLQPGGLMIVTGKGYGSTNVIAMDREGKVLIDRIIQVEGPADNLVTVYRGVERESYSCTPICQRRITLGDGSGYFTSALQQVGVLNGQATGNAAAAAAAQPNKP